MSRSGFSCKVVFLGDTAVGKSCLTVRFARNEYLEFQEPTIGAAFLAKNIDYQGKKNKIRNMGYCRSRKISKFGPNVLSRCKSGHCCV